MKPEMKKGGKAEDKLIGLKSIQETVPETEKRLCTTVTDKVKTSP